ncbi:DUF4446 family protein [Nocardioides marmorisolisilvae]|uniref:DUF4446 family protein n=1 Tax=Nocardioides marmorisolisilvae TaxID=1542737 RepID=A0A3N0E0N2_9ACTN|nr:DUF4446 family protein [Nocardioides marmorisolisilvae]
MVPRRAAASRRCFTPRLDRVNTALSVLALLAALTALGLQLAPRFRQAPEQVVDVSDLPQDALGLRHEVAALRAEAATALKHLAVVRYDAFEDTGGQLSWSLAILDDHGDGTVLTSIHGRTEARTYAKSISAWRCEQPLSPEESDAVAHARG